MNEQQNDHDLLISLKAEVTTKLDRVIEDVKELKDNVAKRVTDLENEKVNKTEFDEVRDDHEARLRFIERYVWIAIGVVGVLQLYFAYRQAFPNS
jgi:hypothetical protein